VDKNEFFEQFEVVEPPDLGGFMEGNAGGSSVRKEEGQVLYRICKVFKPKRVLETGTHTGSSTNYLLKYAQEEDAMVYSFDVTRAGRDILDELRSRLVLTTCQPKLWRRPVDERQIERVRKKLLETAAAGVDLFFHDSDHRYENAKWEFDNITKFMEPGQPVILHDVLHQTDSAQTHALFHEVECSWRHIFPTANGLGLIVL